MKRYEPELSGPNPDWTTATMQESVDGDLRDQCKAVGVAFFVKQLEVDGKVTANASEFPEDPQIQEFPSAS